MKLRENYTCPLELVHDLLRGKWKMVIIYQLGSGKKRFSDLKNEISSVSEKVLSEQLNELVCYGIIHKKVFDGYPLRVEYTLTDMGIEILDAVAIFQKVGQKYIKSHLENKL